MHQIGAGSNLARAKLRQKLPKPRRVARLTCKLEEKAHLNRLIDSSARMPLLILIVANGVSAAISRLVTMIWPILAASCSIEAGVDHAPEPAPDNGAHAHRAGLAGSVDRGPLELLGAVLRKKAPERHHLGMGGGVLLLDAEIAAAREHLAALGDDGAEGEVALSRLLDGEPHEGLVARLRGLFRDRGARRCGKRHGERAERAREEMAAA